MKNKVLILFLAFALFFVGLNTHVSAKENFFYIVQKNDTITKISEMFDVASNDIILHNRQLINTNLLIPNEFVNIPNVNNNTFGVIYKQNANKKDETQTVMVSNFNYENSEFLASDLEIDLLELINKTRNDYKRTSLTYDKTLSLIAKNETDILLNKDISKLQSNKNLVKKLSFYNINYIYAGQLSLMGQSSPKQISDLLNSSALYDYILNTDYTSIGLYIVEMNETLYTSIYFAC